VNRRSETGPTKCGTDRRTRVSQSVIWS